MVNIEQPAPSVRDLFVTSRGDPQSFPPVQPHVGLRIDSPGEHQQVKASTFPPALVDLFEWETMDTPITEHLDLP